MKILATFVLLNFFLGISFCLAFSEKENSINDIDSMSLKIDTIYGNSFCQKANLIIPFTVSGTFASKNIFTAYLSDSNGSFNNLLNIGEFSGTTSGTITVIIPATTPTGNGYRIKIISSKPPFSSADNGTNIIINQTPKPIIIGTSSVCLNDISSYSATSSPDVSFQWTVYRGVIQGSSTLTSIDVLWSYPYGGEIYLVQRNNITGCKDSTFKRIFINPIIKPTIACSSMVCENSIVKFNSNPLSNGLTNKWDAIGGNIIGPSSGYYVDILWLKAGSGTVSLIQTNSIGCKDSVKSMVNINPLPKPTLSGSTIVCANNVYKYQSNNSVSKWTVTNGTIISGLSPIEPVLIKWGNMGTGKIKLYLEHNFTHCSNTFEQTITINPLPKPTITGEISVLPNSTMYYQTQTETNNSNNWSVKGGIINGSTTNSYISVTWGSIGSGTITLVQIMDSTGCRDSINKYIIISENPKANIFGKMSVCEFDIEKYNTSKKNGVVNEWTVKGGSMNEKNPTDSIIVHWGKSVSSSIKLVQTMKLSGYKDSIIQNVIINKLPKKPLITRSGNVLVSSDSTGNQWYIRIQL
ncbi:MAG: carboxypeptidase regulatory-like protein [Ignavibacteria bacterium]|nr:carboxypeptidase regulatory-like protein [Ignavibacteria bacterium]